MQNLWAEDSRVPTKICHRVGHLVHLHVGHNVRLHIGHYVSNHVGHRNVVSTLCEVRDDDRMEIWNTYGRTTDLLTDWSVSDTCMSKNLSTTFTYVLDQVSRIWQSHTKDCFLFSVLIFIKEFNLSIYKFVVIWPFSTFWSLSHILILFQK